MLQVNANTSQWRCVCLHPACPPGAWQPLPCDVWQERPTLDAWTQWCAKWLM
jgi:hypothetical protein